MLLYKFPHVQYSEALIVINTFTHLLMVFLYELISETPREPAAPLRPTLSASGSCHVLKAELNSKTSVTIELNLFFIALTSRVFNRLTHIIRN